jgi:phage tail-like protein
VASQAYPFVAFNFEVQLHIPNASGLGLSDPLVAGEFAECDGLEMTMEPKKVKEGGNNTTQVNLVGPVSYGNLTLKRGMTPNFDLWTWFRLATAGPTRGLRAQGAVALWDAQGTLVAGFQLADCLPIKLKGPSLNAKDGPVAIEELQLAYASLTLQVPGAPAP